MSTRIFRTLRTMTVLLAVCLSGVGSVRAATLMVYPDGSGTYPTIQAAIDACTNGDVIELADGVFTGPGNRDLQLGSEHIRSHSGNAMTCVLALEGYRIGYTWPGSPEFENLTFRNGDALRAGLSNTIFRGCRFEQQIAIFSQIDQASVLLDRCVVFASGGASGQGVDARDCLFRECSTPIAIAWTIDMERCRFVDNTAEYLIRPLPEMVYISGIARLGSCSFLNNRGCVSSFQDSHVYVDSCLFAGSAGSPGTGGPALVLANSTLSVTRSTFACLDGPAVSLEDSPAELTRSILAFGTQAVVTCAGASPVSISCCDLYGNTGGDWTGCIAGQDGQNGNFSADPLFCGPQFMDPYTLSSSSPCAGGPCGLIGALPVGCSGSAVGGPEPIESVRLIVSPNPLRDTACIRRAGLAQFSAEDVMICDTAGRNVRVLKLASGVSEITWDRRDHNGRRVPAGLYRFRTEGRNPAAGAAIVLP